LSSKQAILKKAVALIAERGYSGVSMRQLANAVGMSPATLYHHFPDKQSLYKAAVMSAFADKETAFKGVWSTQQAPKNRLLHYVSVFFQVLSDDPDFHRLLQREILEGEPERMRLLAQVVFKQQFDLLIHLAEQLAPHRDAHLTSIAIVSLIKHHIEMRSIRPFLPGWKPEHEDPSFMAKHIVDLILTGITKPHE
jgi:AcrR family transcriptional regulator